MRGDLGITYDEDVLRLMDIFRSMGFATSGVVITHYANQRFGRHVPHAASRARHQELPALPIAGYP